MALQDAMAQVMKGSVEPSRRWVRVKYGDVTLADSTAPILLIQFGQDVMPTYFFTQDEIDMDKLVSPIEQGDKRYWSVAIDGETFDDVAWTYLNPPEHLSALKDRITFTWWGPLQWYEEAEPVFVHARDPHKRVDVMASSRHIRVEYEGETIADTKRPYLLFETWLPTRYYIPKADVRMEFLQSASLKTACPYKGEAEYWSIQVGDHELENGVWSYPDPIIENPKIKGLMCFFNEKVDIYVDGELMPRPETPWS